MATEAHSLDSAVFLTPEDLALEQARRKESPRGRLLIASCCSGAYLARRVVGRYRELLSQAGSEDDALYLEDIDYRFSDSETCVRLDLHVGGADVFLFQGLFDPTSARTVDQNYLAFLIAARTFREHGASHITGVLPYLAYGRQDKPTTFMREPVTAKLMADLTVSAGVDRLLTWHPHSQQTRGFYAAVPMDMLSPLALFAEVFGRFRGREDLIVVAPDAGASKLVTHFGRALDLACAIASKYRPRAEEAVISEIIGDLAGKRVAIVLDDIISSAGTVHALIRRLVREAGVDEVYLGASHNLCMPVARERLQELHEEYGVQEIVVTNTIPQTECFEALPFLTVKCLGDVLCRAINRIHYNRSLSELFQPA